MSDKKLLNEVLPEGVSFLPDGIEMGKAGLMPNVAFAAGYAPGYDDKLQRAIVVNADEGYWDYTYPINGWRGRELASMLYAERNDSLLLEDLGRPFRMDIQKIKELPGFDLFYVRRLERMQEDVSEADITVVAVEPGYGYRIIVRPVESK